MKKEVKAAKTFVYIRSTGETISVSQAVHDAYYGDAIQFQVEERLYGRCVCPPDKTWICDMDCLICEYHRAGNTVSLDALTGEEKAQLMDTLRNRAVLGRIFTRLRELDPDADTIIAMWQENDRISDHSIAEALERPQSAFANQMKQYRTEFRRILNDAF